LSGIKHLTTEEKQVIVPSNRTVIDNRKVLTTKYLPNSMPSRGAEQKEIARALEPLMEEGYPRNLLIHGPPGTGKTAITEYVIEDLKQYEDIEKFYVNCFDEETKKDVLYDLLEEPYEVPRQGSSISEVKEKLKEKIKSQKSIIIVDEVDQITSGDILYFLSSFMEVPVIMIANDPNVFAYFDDRVQSRLTDVKKLEMKKYSHKQLKNILERRARYGLKENAVKKEVITKIAEKSGGDARKAILTLKEAAYNAEDQGNEKIKKENAKSAIKSAQAKQRQVNSERLSKDQKTLKKILEKAEEPKQMNHIYTKYQESSEIEKPKTKRTIRRYLKKMEHYEFVESQGKASAREYKTT
jgi:orc1/cdc6 family replication initiation protein